jgi:glycosyltransferase involved in cell wall biosynthesis
MERERITCTHVIHSLEYGGAQRDLYYYVKLHDRDKFNMNVVSFHPGGGMIGQIENLGVGVQILETRSSDPRSAIRLERIFRKQKTRVVHFHNSLPIYTGVPAAILAGVPVKLMTEHSIYHPGKAGGTIKRSIYFSLRRRLDLVIACSDYVKQSHADRIDPGRIVTVVNGVDLDHFHMTGDGGDNDRGTIHVGAIGSLTPQKGYSILINAMGQLSGRGIPFELTIVGEGPLRDDLENEAAAVDRGKVTFTGATGDVMEFLPGFDVVVCSSVREGLPLSLLEAMAAGRPVIATDVGGNREAVVDGLTGILVPPNDPYALADALESLWKDAGKRAEMGRNGRARAEELFSAKRMVERTEEIYCSLLGY